LIGIELANDSLRFTTIAHGPFLDADHINLTTVERFIGPCDFFTIDGLASVDIQVTIC